MKILGLLSLAVCQVLATVQIPESVFNGYFSDTGDAIVIATPLVNSNMPISANITFVSRAIGNTTIADTFSLSAGGVDIGTVTRSLIVHSSQINPLFGEGQGMPFLEMRYEIELTEVAAPEGMNYMVVGDPAIDSKNPRVYSVEFMFKNVNTSSSVSEIYSEDNEVIWRVFPSTSFYPSKSSMETGGLIDRNTPFYLTIYPLTHKNTIEIVFYAHLRPGGSLIPNVWTNLVIQPNMAMADIVPGENNDEAEEEEEEEEEPAPEALFSAPSSEPVSQAIYSA